MRWLTALALTACGLGGLAALVPGAPLTGDGQYYIAFVRNGLQHGASSWHERRLLGPWIAHLLPVDPQPGFFILTLASLAMTVLLMWRAARVLVGDEARALVAVPLLLGTWVVTPNLREYGLIDPLAWAFVAGVWLATIQGRWRIAAALAAIGVLAKEVVVLAALAAAAAAWQPRRPYVALAVAAPAALMVALLMLLLPGSGSDAGGYVSTWARDGLGSLGAPRAAFLVFATYGGLWLLLPRAWSRLPLPVRRAALVYLVAAVGLPLVGSPERMEEAIFPLVVSAAVLGTRDWGLSLVWLLGLGNLAFVARVGGGAPVPAVLAWGGLALACALVGLSYARTWAARAAELRPAPTRG